MAVRRNDFACKLAKAALHAVADNRSADLLANGETDALQRVAVLAITNEKDESRRRRAPAGVRSEEVRAFTEDC